MSPILGPNSPIVLNNNAIPKCRPPRVVITPPSASTHMEQKQQRQSRDHINRNSKESHGDDEGGEGDVHGWGFARLEWPLQMPLLNRHQVYLNSIFVLYCAFFRSLWQIFLK